MDSWHLLMKHRSVISRLGESGVKRRLAVVTNSNIVVAWRGRIESNQWLPAPKAAWRNIAGSESWRMAKTLAISAISAKSRLLAAGVASETGTIMWWLQW